MPAAGVAASRALTALVVLAVAIAILAAVPAGAATGVDDLDGSGLLPAGSSSDWLTVWNELRAGAGLDPVTVSAPDAPESLVAASWARYVVDNDTTASDPALPGWTAEGEAAGADRMVVATVWRDGRFQLDTSGLDPAQIQLILHPGVRRIAFGAHWSGGWPTAEGDVVAATVAHVSFDMGPRGHDTITFPAAGSTYASTIDSPYANRILVAGVPDRPLVAPTATVAVRGAAREVRNVTLVGHDDWMIVELAEPLPTGSTVVATVRDGGTVVHEWSFDTPGSLVGTEFPADGGTGSGTDPALVVDVPAGRYYSEPVAWALRTGISTGVGGTHRFEPDRAVTRGETVTFLWRWFAAPDVPADDRFDDTAGAYYSEAVDWAVAMELTTGVAGTRRFEPDRAVTRGEVVTFLWRAAGSPSVPGGSSFADVASSAFYAEPVRWAAANGVTTGVGGTDRFEPDRPVTRAELVTFMHRLRGAAID